MSCCRFHQDGGRCTIADGRRTQQERWVEICSAEKGGGRVISGSCLSQSVPNSHTRKRKKETEIEGIFDSE